MLLHVVFPPHAQHIKIPLFDHGTHDVHLSVDLIIYDYVLIIITPCDYVTRKVANAMS